MFLRQNNASRGEIGIPSPDARLGLRWRGGHVCVLGLLTLRAIRRSGYPTDYAVSQAV